MAHTWSTSQMSMDYHRELVGAIEDYLRHNKTFARNKSVLSGVNTRRALFKVIKYAKNRRKSLLQFEKEVRLYRLTLREKENA